MGKSSSAIPQPIRRPERATVGVDLIREATNRSSYRLGITIHRMRYGSKPGTPPGSKAIRKASLNHQGLIP
jgi:hypothetical protein